MNAAPDSTKHPEDHEVEDNTDLMGLQLSKEVASWSKQRGQRSDETAFAQKQPAPEQHARRPAGTVKKPSPAPGTTKPTGAGSRPFRMLYDGQMQADYIRHLLDRGSR